ncbi:MAG: MFS transporter [Chloroflexi bacterium]|nr:MFS transporter [Chloroflexota bacterium]
MLKLGATARGLVPLYGTTVMLAFGHGMVVVTIPVLATFFDISIGVAAQVVTAHAVGRFAGQPVAGVLVDRLGPRLSLIGGPAVVAVAALSVVVTPWFAALLAAVFLMGVGDSVFMLAREVAGIDTVRPAQRGRLMSGFFGFNSLGMALGPVLGGLLTELISFRAVFVVYAVLAALAVPVALTVKARRQAAAQPRADAAASGPGQGLAGRFRALAGLFHAIEPRFRRTYLALTFATFSMMIYRMTLHSMLPLYAGSQLGFSPTQVGLLFSISGVFILAMIVPAGFVMDKIGRKWATVPSTAVPGAVFLFFPFADTFLQLAVLVSLLGIANGLSLGSVAVSTYDIVPERVRGRLQAARRTVAETGAIGAPAAGGAMANVYGPAVPFVVFGPVMLLAAVLLAFGSRETLVKQPARGVQGAVDT